MPFISSQPCSQSHFCLYPISTTPELLVSKHVVFFYIKVIIIIIVLLFLKLFPLPLFPSLLFSKSHCLYIFAFGLPLA